MQSMSIEEMKEKLGVTTRELAEASGTSIYAINNAKSNGQRVVELKDGSFIALRPNAVIYKKV